jgi:hypothetical protein
LRGSDVEHRDTGARRGRYLALLLDALRPEAATPLPVPPITYEEIERALGVAE